MELGPIYRGKVEANGIGREVVLNRPRPHRGNAPASASSASVSSLYTYANDWRSNSQIRGLQDNFPTTNWLGSIRAFPQLLPFTNAGYLQSRLPNSDTIPRTCLLRVPFAFKRTVKLGPRVCCHLIHTSPLSLQRHLNVHFYRAQLFIFIFLCLPFQLPLPVRTIRLRHCHQASELSPQVFEWPFDPSDPPPKVSDTSSKVRDLHIRASLRKN